MNVFRRMIDSLFPSKRSRLTEERVDAILRTAFRRAQTAEPDTQRHWSLLSSTLSTTDAPIHSPWTRPRLAMAFVAVSFILAGVLFVSIPRGSDPARYVTVRGEQTDVTLSDGTEVTLNHTSELVVEHMREGKPRRVTLSGEAYFRVRSNNTPFIVSNGFATVSVLGTEFNVRSRRTELDVSVLHGSVKLQRHGGQDQTPLVLTPGERARCQENGMPERLGNIPSPDYPGWMHGKLYLERTGLGQACEEIASRFNITIEVRDTFGADDITGTLDASSAEAALRSLCVLTGRTFSREGRSYILQ